MSSSADHGESDTSQPRDSGQEHPLQQPYARPMPPYPQSYAEQPGDLPAVRPGTITLAVVLLVLSAAPWLFIYADNAFVASSTTSRTGRADPNGGLLLMGILFVVFVLRAAAGRNWARVTITVMAIVFDLMLSQVLLVSGGGLLGETGLFFALVAGWTVLLSLAGLVLMYGNVANAYFAEATAHRAYLAMQHAHRQQQPPSPPPG